MIEGGEVPFVLVDEPGTEHDQAIADTAASFVVNGATLQCGIGPIPNLVALALAQRQGGGYGIHSEMFTNGLFALHKAGKVTNANKGEFAGASVTTFALGSAEMYAWLHDNRDVVFLRSMTQPSFATT